MWFLDEAVLYCLLSPGAFTIRGSYPFITGHNAFWKLLIASQILGECNRTLLSESYNFFIFLVWINIYCHHVGRNNKKKLFRESLSPLKPYLHFKTVFLLSNKSTKSRLLNQKEEKPDFFVFVVTPQNIYLCLRTQWSDHKAMLYYSILFYVAAGQ